jgi:hypothetical protein
MSRTAEDFEKLAEQLQSFLTQSGWSPRREAKGLTFYYPPDSLGIRGKYSIALPVDARRPGVGSLLHGAAAALQDIYGVGDVGSLVNRAAALGDWGGPARIVSRFIDGKTEGGSIPLASLGAYAENLEKSLYNGAKFKLGEDNKVTRLLAQSFAKECRFLQSEVGSFIAKIEVPQTTLRQADLFGREEVSSTQVCSSIFSAIQFLNERVLNGNAPIDSEDSLADAIALFDVELLESLAKTLTGPEMDAIEFAFEAGSIIRTTKTGWLSSEKTDRLRQFVEFIKAQLRGENDIDVSGSIVELRSRDPEGNKNYIRVVSVFHGDRTFITAALSNEQYKRALSAHQQKRTVRLRGDGMRLKTQIRLTKVEDFS